MRLPTCAAATAAAILLSLTTWGWAQARPSPSWNHGPHARIMEGYFAEWGIYGVPVAYNVANLQENGVADRLGVLDYAFGNVAPVTGPPDAQCHIADSWADYQDPSLPSVDGQPYPGPLYGNFAALKQLKKLHPRLKVVISLGGASAANAAGFAYAASTPALRRQLVSSCIDMFIQGNVAPGATPAVSAAGLFDGFDIDWEFPRNAANFTALMAEFRKQLNALGAKNHRHYLLTMFAPAGSQNYDFIDLAKVAAIVDWMNLQGYDYHGTWETSTNFNAPLFNSPRDPNAAEKLDINDVVDTYESRGVPASKIVIGVPMYSYGWAGVASTNHGLYQVASGPAASPANDILQSAGVATYHTLVQLRKTDGYRQYFDRYTKSGWLYSPTEQTFWSYNGPLTTTIKMLYVRQRHLRGAFLWSFMGDSPQGTLAKTMETGLGLRRPTRPGRGW